MKTDQLLPSVRPLDISPFQNERDEQYFALHDLTQVAPRPLAVSWPGYFILMHLDGRHTCQDVQSAFVDHFGQAISIAQINEMIDILDRALLLQTPSFQEAYTRLRNEYCASDARDCRHKYPPAPELRSLIEKMLEAGVAMKTADLRGLIAPHLDYARGGRCYADAYASLCAAPPADRYVILGTNHYGRSGAAVATTKDFLTPLGRTPTDREFIKRLELGLGQTITEDQFDHNSEHSIELQVQILQTCQAGHPFEIVPILCPDPSGPSGTQPHDGKGPDLGDFADMLARLVADSDQRTILIAGADLSHVGRRFGDEAPTTPEFLERVGRDDRMLLDLLESRLEDAFIEELRMSENPTRVCGAGCIYALLRATPDQPCRVLRYEQAVDMETETHVTCAAAIVGR